MPPPPQPSSTQEAEKEKNPSAHHAQAPKPPPSPPFLIALPNVYKPTHSQISKSFIRCCSLLSRIRPVESGCYGTRFTNPHFYNSAHKSCFSVKNGSLGTLQTHRQGRVDTCALLISESPRALYAPVTWSGFIPLFHQWRQGWHG